MTAVYIAILVIVDVLANLLVYSRFRGLEERADNHDRDMEGNIENWNDRIGQLESGPVMVQPGYAMPFPSPATMERNLGWAPGTLRCYCVEDAADFGTNDVPEVNDQGHCEGCGYPRSSD